MNSIFVKCLLVIATSVALVAVGFGAFAFRSQASLVEDATRQRALEVTTLVTAQIYGAIRFGKPEAIEAQVETVRDQAGGVLVGGAAMNAEGAVVTAVGAVEGVEAALVALGEQAIAEDAVVRSPDGLSVAVPARSPKNGEVGGALVLNWTMEPLEAGIREAQSTALAVAGGLFVLALAISGFILRSMIARPLERVSAAMARVAKADYSLEIPGTARGDEVGLIARTLDDFRASLKAAAADARTAAFKGAGFDASSAAIMISDEQGTISFVNDAFETLFQELKPVLAPQLPGVSLGDVTGAALGELKPVLGDVLAAMDDPASLPRNVSVVLGDHRVQVWVNKITDGSGGLLGHVFEWQDVTKAWLNRKILDTLNESQIRVEFSPQGALLDANRSFEALAGSKAEKRMSVLFARRGEAPDFVTDLQMEGRVFGKFDLSPGTGSTHVLEGGFSLVRDESGAPMRILFLGTDVTAVQAAMAAAEEDKRRLSEEQARMSKEQAGIVAALRASLGELSRGDLSGRITTAFPAEHETLRQDYNGTVESLSDAVSTVSENALRIRDSSNEIGTAMTDLSHRTEQQAATLEETAAALEEMTASVRQSATGAREAREMADGARTSAEQSGRIVDETVSAMAEIEESSTEIQRITNVINEIAFQTNLLALNAGVEAARAGDAGKGFAVVASEVRQLAQRSSESASKIESLLSRSREQVQRGVSRVAETRERLTGIIEAVLAIAGKVAEISHAVEEQSMGIAELNVGVTNLDQFTQRNVAMFEETTAATQALTELALQLEQAVSRFSTDRPDTVEAFGAYFAR